jgi:O-antigen/teichoic acid export membrane protein
MSAYFLYRRNAYRIYPALSIRWSLFRRDRLREVTGFSIYTSVIDWANKLNYQLDAIVIGAFMGAAPVAVWAIAARLISATQRLTNQLNSVLFPVVVDSDTTQRTERLQTLMLEGTRLSLAMVVPIAAVLILLAAPLVRAWVGVQMLGSVPVIQILAVTVALRVGNATGTTVLKGAGRVRYLALVNITAGIVNLVLSALLIRPFGLIGVAVGTLIPVGFATVFVLFPAACRRVGLPVIQVARHAVWPALWPALVVGGSLTLMRRISSGTLLAVAVEATVATVAYLALFLIAVGPRDRTEYAGKLLELVGRPRHLASAA